MSGPLRIVNPGETEKTVAAEQEVVLHLDDVAVSYNGRLAIREATFDVTGGSIMALIGPSGCGKSSLLQSINRMTDLIPGARVDGQLHLGGLDVLAPETDVTALRRRVGMIFQKPNPFPTSIRSNLAMPLHEHGVRDRDQVDAAIQGALEEVGLWKEVLDRLDSPAQALSGVLPVRSSCGPRSSCSMSPAALWIR